LCDVDLQSVVTHLHSSGCKPPVTGLSSDSGFWIGQLEWFEFKVEKCQNIKNESGVIGGLVQFFSDQKNLDSGFAVIGFITSFTRLCSMDILNILFLISKLSHALLPELLRMFLLAFHQKGTQ